MELEILDLDNEEQLRFLFQTRRHPDVVSNLFGNPPSTMKQHCSWLKEHHKVSHFIYLLKEAKVEQWIGYCQCIPNQEEKKIEVGWVIHPIHQGKGHGKRAVSLFLKFIRYPDYSVILEVKDSNKAAISIYERSGFRDLNFDRELSIHRMILKCEDILEQRVDILSIGFGKPICLDAFLSSLGSVTSYPYRLFYFDNLSLWSEENKAVIAKHSELFKKSGGAAYFCNKNAVNAPYWWAWKNLVCKESKYFVMTDPDLILPSDRGCWLRRAIELLDSDKDIGVVSIRNKPHSPDIHKHFIERYESWKKYKDYSDVVEGLPLYHYLTLRIEMIQKWELSGFDYFWHDAFLRSKIIEEGFDCVALDWDIYHYDGDESVLLYPALLPCRGSHVFNKMHHVSDTDLVRFL